MALFMGIIVLVVGGAYYVNQNNVISADTVESPNNKQDVTPIVTASTETKVAAATPTQGQGASTVAPADRIVVAYPAGGEQLSIGKSYDIRWTNYKGTEALTIALQPVAGTAKIITTNIPAVSGSYKWTVGSEQPGKYLVQVYPSGGRPYVGYSKEFNIVGEPLIVVTAPTVGSRLNMSNSIAITGKARSIYNEGEFSIVATYLLDGKKQTIAQTVATCDMSGDGCDWTSGTLVNFKAALDLSKSPVCGVNIEFYKAVAKDNEVPTLVYALPVSLFGNDNCQ